LAWDKNSADDVSTSTTFGGDVSGTYDNLQINALAIGNAELATDAVTTDKILDGAVTNLKIQNSPTFVGTVTLDKLVVTSVSITSPDLTGITATLIIYTGTGSAFTNIPTGVAGQLLYIVNSSSDNAAVNFYGHSIAINNIGVFISDGSVWYGVTN
jgi:hypothetical protein